MYDFFLVPIGVTGFQFRKFRLPRDRIVVTLLERPVFPSEFHKRNLKAGLFRMKIEIAIIRRRTGLMTLLLRKISLRMNGL